MMMIMSTNPFVFVYCSVLTVKEKIDRIFFGVNFFCVGLVWRMMSESNKAINVFSAPKTSSRLSPLANPFAISNPFNRHESFDPLLESSSSLSTSSLDQRFRYLHLGGRGHHGQHAYHSDTTSPCVDGLHFEPNSCFVDYPFDESPVHTNFTLSTHQSSQTSFIPSSSSLSNVRYKGGQQGIATNQQGREVPHKNDQIGGAGSLSCNNLLEQGTTIKGSKLVSETSSVLHVKGSVVIGKDNGIRPDDKEKIHPERSYFRLANSEVNLLNKCMTKPLSVTSDLSFSPIPQDAQGQLSYSAPLMTWDQCDSTVITNERCFPHFGSSGAETVVSCAPECFSYSAEIFKPSSASSNPPIVKSLALDYVASSGNDAVSKSNTHFGYVLPSMMDTVEVQNPVDKMACHDEVIIEKGQKGPVRIETKNSSIIAKSNLQIVFPNVPEDLTLELHGAKAGIPDDKSSTNHDDSDVDSPCWEGTQAYKSPLRDSVPVNYEDSKGQSPAATVSVPLNSENSKNGKVARNSLNPLAPVFIPRNFKRKVDYHKKECHGDSSSSLQKSAALAVATSSREHILSDPVKAGAYPTERISAIARKEHGIPYTPVRSSAVNSSCSFQPYLGEEYVTYESQLVTGTSVVGSMDGTADATHNGLISVEDIAHNGPNTSISFLRTEIALNSHSTGVGLLSDFTERLQEPSKSTPPKLDVKLMINTIQYLSELLLQNSSFDLGSLSEHEHDKLLNIINNLYVVRNRAGQMAVRAESSDSCALYTQRQPADHYEV
ncbi:hypothetical protein DITRI_Ditri04bG0150800 [Diplodiscus trichospermus]